MGKKNGYPWKPMVYCSQEEVIRIAKAKGLTPVVEYENYVRLVRVLTPGRYKISWSMFWMLLSSKGLAVFKTQYGEFLKILDYEKNIFHTVRLHEDRGETFKRPDWVRGMSHD